MLEKWTHGAFVATPHRVRNKVFKGKRFSMPFFFDPSLTTTCKSIPKDLIDPSIFDTQKIYTTRWDDQKLADLPDDLEYGDWYKAKIIKSFPFIDFE